MLKIYRVRKETIKHVDKSGIIESDNRSWMRYSAGGGYIYIEEMQLERQKKDDDSQTFCVVIAHSQIPPESFY